MKRALIVAVLMLLVASAMFVQAVDVALANFFPGDALIIFTPISKMVYTNTSVQFNITANVANPTPEVVSITYMLDQKPNVTITDLKKTLRIPGHIDGSQFSAEMVLEDLAEGNHTISAYSKDASGKQMSASIEFVIDSTYTTPLSVMSPLNTTYSTNEVPLTFVCREDRNHDGSFAYAVYVLDGIGSNFIYENSTLTDLPFGDHSMTVTVWTGNGFFSETVYFTISNQPPSPTDMPTNSPTQQPTLYLSPTLTPTQPPYSNDIPVGVNPLPLIAGMIVATVAVVAVVFIFHFRKRR